MCPKTAGAYAIPLRSNIVVRIHAGRMHTEACDLFVFFRYTLIPENHRRHNSQKGTTPTNKEDIMLDSGLTIP